MDLKAVDLKGLDESLFRIWQRVWHLRWLQPENREAEMERFLASQAYEPRFTYPELAFAVEEERALLNALLAELSMNHEPLAQPLALLFTKKVEKLQHWLSMLATRGTAAFTEHAIAYYGLPDEALVADARGLFGAEEQKKERATIDAASAVRMLREEARRLGCTVKVRRGLASRADCVLPERTLYLRAGAMFTERDIRKLAIHELGVHARRAMNGLRQEYKLFFMGTAEYETTEEGLAGLLEERAGVASGMRTKGALVLAVDVALRKGFRAVYGLLRTAFPPERAYRLAVRVKRGLGDTGRPGAFTKDHIYLKGLRLVEALSPGEVERLFLGRIAVEDRGLLDIGLLRRMGSPRAGLPASARHSGA